MANEITLRLGKANTSDNNNLKCYLDVKQGGQDLISAFSTQNPDASNRLAYSTNHDYTKQLQLTLFNIDNVTDSIFSVIIICFSTEYPDGRTTQLFFNVPAGKSQTQTFSIPSSSFYFGTLLSIYNHKTSTTSDGISYVPSGTLVNGVASDVLSKKVSDTSFIGTKTPNTTLNPNYQTGAPEGGITPTAPSTTKLTETSLRVSWTNTIGAAKWRFKHVSSSLGITIYSPELTTGTYFDFTEYLLPHPVGDDDTVVAGTYAFSVEVQVTGDTTWYGSAVGNGVYISGVLSTFPNIPPYATMTSQNSIDFDCRASSFDHVVRIFSLFKDGSLFKKSRKDGQGVWKDVDIVTNAITTTTSNWFTIDGNQFKVGSLNAGIYKCIFKYDSYYDTPYSAEVTLGGKSATPVIAIDGTNPLKINVSSLTSSGSKTVSLFRGTEQISSGTIADGVTVANFIISLYGAYTVKSTETGKAISDASNSLTIVTKSTTPDSVSYTKVLESYKNTIDSKVTIKGRASDDCVEIKIYKKSDNSVLATINTFTIVNNVRTFTYEGNNTLNVGNSYYIKQRETVDTFALLESDASPDYIISEFNPTCTITNLAINKGTVGENDFVVTFVTPNPIAVSYTISNNPVYGQGDIYQTSTLALDVNPSVTNGKIGYINLVDVPEGSYYIHVYSTTTGSNCSASSQLFTFDIQTSEVVEVELNPSFGQDCLSMSLGVVTENKNIDGSVTFMSSVSFSSPLGGGTLYYGELTEGSIVYGQTPSAGIALDSGNFSITIPANKVPARGTTLKFTVTVNTTSIPQYGCSVSKDVVTVSDSSLTQSSIPVIRDINENRGRIFIECCLNAKVIVYRNGDIYATRENTTDSVIEVFNPDIQLQIGDTINAKQICPNQTISELSATRTITSVCSPINGGSINGLDTVSKGSVIMYSIVNLTGERPYEYLAEVSGGTIIAGQGTDNISVKWGSGNSGIVGFTITNCSGNSQVLLTKKVTLVNNNIPSVSNRPTISSFSGKILKGTAIANSTITIYDGNNMVVKTGIEVTDAGLWNSGVVKPSLNYYAISVLDGVRSDISNIITNPAYKQINKDMAC